MNRNLRISLVSICVGLVLFVFTAALLPLFFNSRHHAARVEKYLSKVIGLPCTVGKNVEVFFLPKTSITFDNLSIKNPEGFTDEEFLSIESGQIIVNPWHFFSGGLKVDRLILSGIDVNLEENKQGQKNWHGVQTSFGPTIVDLFAITDGELSWKSDVVKRGYTFADFSLVMSDYHPGDVAGIELQTVFNGMATKLNGRVNWQNGSGDASELFYRGDLEVYSPNGNIVQQDGRATVFLGNAQGSVDFFTRNVDVVLEPHGFKNGNDADGSGPLIADTFKITGDIHDIQCKLGDREIAYQAKDLTIIDVPVELLEVAMRFGGKELPQEFLVQKRVSELIALERPRVGTIRVGEIQVVQ